MSSSSINWQITATDRYVDQVCKLPLDVQNNIQQQWIKVAKQEDPRSLGQWEDCGSDDEDCPFVVVIYEGLPYEFMYEIDPDNEKITLVDCYTLDIFHPNS